MDGYDVLNVAEVVVLKIKSFIMTDQQIVNNLIIGDYCILKDIFFLCGASRC